MPRAIDASEADELLSRFDGLLLMGGGDVEPRRYGQDPVPQVYGVSAERDSFEIELALAATRLQVPILAICRGIQVLNVALGGTLHQHIGETGEVSHGLSDKHDWERHSVRLDPDSRLAQILRSEAISQCASHHHQAIDVTAPGLRPVGWSQDEVIEAVEDESGLVLGVQWHPEVTAAEDSLQQALFDELIRLAGDRKALSFGR